MSKNPSKKKMTRKSTKGPGHTFGKLKIPRDTRVRDTSVVDGEGYGYIPSPDYDPEDGDWGRRDSND